MIAGSIVDVIEIEKKYMEFSFYFLFLKILMLLLLEQKMLKTLVWANYETHAIVQWQEPSSTLKNP